VPRLSFPFGFFFLFVSLQHIFPPIFFVVWFSLYTIGTSESLRPLLTESASARFPSFLSFRFLPVRDPLCPICRGSQMTFPCLFFPAASACSMSPSATPAAFFWKTAACASNSFLLFLPTTLSSFAPQARCASLLSLPIDLAFRFSRHSPSLSTDPPSFFSPLSLTPSAMAPVSCFFRNLSGFARSTRVWRLPFLYSAFLIAFRRADAFPSFGPIAFFSRSSFPRLSLSRVILLPNLSYLITRDCLVSFKIFLSPLSASPREALICEFSFLSSRFFVVFGVFLKPPPPPAGFLKILSERSSPTSFFPLFAHMFFFAPQHPFIQCFFVPPVGFFFSLLTSVPSFFSGRAFFFLFADLTYSAGISSPRSTPRIYLFSFPVCLDSSLYNSSALHSAGLRLDELSCRPFPTICSSRRYSDGSALFFRVCSMPRALFLF